ncbi:small multi-drug export protein [Eubacteriales bacterium OttesenSCG-928-N13]|nr:small multi-drug export protein [Eubacteriales bacterium OttesenSCG-928-N13]
MQPAFIWTEHIGTIIKTSLLSLVPTFEGRYAVIGMLGMGMPIVFSYLLALIVSYLPVPFILWLYLPIVKWIQTLPYNWLNWLKKFCAWIEARAKRKASKMDNLGLLALFAFVAIPVPGTGIWTGSLIAVLFGFDRKKAALVIFAGNIVACLITTVITVSGMTALGQQVPWF